MNDETMRILIVSVLVPFLVTFVTLFQQYSSAKSAQLKVKMHNDEIAKYIDIAEDAVVTAVGAVNQVLVDSLKELAANGKLSEDEKTLAFLEARNRALLIMGVAGKAAVTELYGSFDQWMDSKIDYYVGIQKKKPAPVTIVVQTNADIEDVPCDILV